jgi:hypothetical protein
MKFTQMVIEEFGNDFVRFLRFGKVYVHDEAVPHLKLCIDVVLSVRGARV